MTPKNLRNDRDAQVGIGTMIVFIATILVAAVAAGVLIDTSQKLQDKSTQTGNEATQSVGTSLTVESIVGSRQTASQANLDQLDIYVVLAPGADPVDLSDLVMQYNDGEALTVYQHGVAVSATEFTVTFIRDADSSGANDVMSAGDYVRITIGDATDSTPTIALPTDTKVDVNLIPQSGTDVSFGFTTPPTYGTDTAHGLF